MGIYSAACHSTAVTSCLVSLGPTRRLFWTAIIMMTAVSPAGMTPSAESQLLSSSFPHTLVSAAVLNFQPDPGQDGVQLVAGVQTSRSLGQGCPLHSLKGAPSALNLHSITRSVWILWEAVPHLYLCSMAKTSPCMRAPVYRQTSPSPGWSLDMCVTCLLLPRGPSVCDRALALSPSRCCE